MSGVLLTHRGAVRVNRQALMSIEPPAATATWKPVAHGVLVNTLTEILSSRGLAVRKEDYAVQNDGNILFGVLDLAWGDTGEFYAALGLRTSNNKHFAIQIAIGARVVVCDNLLMSGELIALKRKHTAGLELLEELTAGVRRYELGYRQLCKRIERLKSVSLQAMEARETVFNVFAQKVLPLRVFRQVAVALSHQIVNRTPLTQWTLHNVFTAALKKLKPAVAFEANIKLGKFFALGEPFLPRPEQLVDPSGAECFSSRGNERAFQAREAA